FIKGKMLKPTIISISMATVMAGAAISPALGVIAKAFPEASTTMIKMILTAPAITIIPFTFLTSYLTTKLSKRTVVIIGLSTYLIGGLGPQFMSTIEAIILFRLILGASVGILMPLSESLIYDYYTGTERSSMMGYNAAFSNFGGIITMLIAGWLATFGWRNPFNVYLLGVFIFVLVFFFLPKEEVRKPPAHERNLKIPFAVYVYSFAMGAVMLAYYAVATNMALYLEQTNLGGPALAGTVVALAAIGGMLTSFFLVKVMETLKRFLIPVMLATMGLAFFFLSFTNSILIIMISVVFIGFAQGALFPVLTMKALNRVKLHQTDRAIAVATTFIFTGQFLSPVILDFIAKLANQASIKFQFGILATFLFVSVVVILLAMDYQVSAKAAAELKKQKG
ncbi:MAG TPA: MFS transporter, partial [Syntrophomonadaceae bacterium]|nr:MFS transporter [Syntrophomonadaceae bacterium]